MVRAIPHNSKCRYGERGAADAKPKAQIILDAAKVSAASGGNSEPKQGQRSQSARGFCPRSTMRVPQPDIIEHFGNADAVPQPPERCLSRKAGIMRCCQYFLKLQAIYYCLNRQIIPAWFPKRFSVSEIQIVLFNKFNTKIALYSRHFTSRFHAFVYQAACQPLPSLSPYQLSPFSLSRQIPSFGRLF